MLNQQNGNENCQNPNKFRDYLAVERTMLAWIRTGLTIFTLGSAIARFGGSTSSEISLRNPESEKKSVVSGLILAICGVLCSLYGLWRYGETAQQLRNEKNTSTLNIAGPMGSMIALMLALIAIIIVFFIV